MPDDKLSLTPLERRAKREARRAKQREGNAGRAAKMHAARLEDLTPHESAHPAKNEATPRKSPPQFHTGCSGWFYWHWRDRFYPSTVPASQWFAHYARHFKTVELNAPFYSWPTVATVKSWLRQAGRRNFVYTVKVNELITHVKRFSGTGGLVEDFGYIADLLGKRMGCFLFQLPPSFNYTPARLKKILGQLDPTREMSSSSVTEVGGTRECTPHFEKPAQSSVRAVVRASPTNS